MSQTTTSDDGLTPRERTRVQFVNEALRAISNKRVWFANRVVRGLVRQAYALIPVRPNNGR